MSPIYVIFTLLGMYPNFVTMNYCNHLLDYNCANYTTEVKACSRHHLPKASEVNLSIIEDPDRSNHSSIVVVQFPTPIENCEFELQLYVAPGINDEEDCINYTFNMRDSHPHKNSKYICPENKQHQNLSANSSCVREIAEVWFNHVYTGCYSFVFIVDKSDYEFQKKAFLKTTYKKTEVVTPMVSCNVQSTVNETNNQFIPVQCWAFNDVGPVDAVLQAETTENQSCDHYSNNCRPALNPRPEEIIITTNDSLNMVNIDFPLSEEKCFYKIYIIVKTSINHNNCDILTWKQGQYFISNEIRLCSIGKRQARIRVKEPNTGCYGIVFGTFNKTWILKTEFILVKNKIHLILAIIGIAIIGILVAAVWYSIKILKKGCLHTDAEASASPAEIDVDEMRSIRPQQTHRKDVIMIYVKDNQQFMGEMMDLQRQLAGRTGASIYSWWTPSVIESVSDEGAYEWAATRISQGCRVIWFDTKKARELLASVKAGTPNYTNDRDKNFNRIYQHVIYIKDLDTEYDDHHVVRFTKPGYAVSDSVGTQNSKDPFSKIAVNSRLILPDQVEQLVENLNSNLK